ncbi:MAG: hypothetical protein I3273_05035 [Candidatus Moeniiplasma glomeromycotorum]|nr:hypothetical protein [Candidatus Moeniiplasma glomeromycotorum]MCE8167907.1 hypothetical protein [Candidatus Moeniiplasma glomeromycotorum]MCE8169457.1 hypothetical protein [Candidatus Moeniiplasma glomeromycotorum]
MTFNLENEIKELETKLKDGAAGFKIAGFEHKKLQKNLNIEGVKGGHFGNSSTWLEYLKDTPNSSEIKDKNDEKQVEAEYTLRKKSVMYCFAIVVTEYFYSKMRNEKNQIKKNSLYEAFEKVRNYQWKYDTENLYGTHGNKDGSEDEMKVYHLSEDGGGTPFKYGISYKDAIIWMMDEGTKSISTFDLPAAKTLLKDGVRNLLNENFSGTDLANFEDLVNNLGHDNTKWDKDDWLDGIIDGAVDENAIRDLNESMYEAIGHIFIDWYIDKANGTINLEEKKEYLKKIEDFFVKNHFCQRALNSIDNKSKIDKLTKEVGETAKENKSEPKITDFYVEDKNLEGILDLTDKLDLERVWCHHQIKLITDFDLHLATILKKKELKGLQIKVNGGVSVSKYIPANETLEKLYPDDGTRTNFTSLDLTQKGLRGSLDLSDFDNLEELVVNLDCPWNRKSIYSNYINGINFPESLKHLTLINNPNNWDLGRLGNLVNLETLILRGENYKQPAQWTGSLKLLEGLTGLKELDISYCPNIRQGLESLENLEKLTAKDTIYEKQLKSFHGDVRAWKIIVFPEKVSDEDTVISEKIKDYLTESHDYLKFLNERNVTDRDLENKIKILEERSRSL